jgi:N-acetylmuramoyl-L-alanine amidase
VIIVATNLRFIAALTLLMVCSAPVWSARALVTTAAKSGVRCGPSSEYARLTVLPPQVRLWAIGREGSWYQVKLAENLVGWVQNSDVRELGTDVTLRTARLTDMSVTSQNNGVTRVTFFLNDRVAFRIRQSVFPSQLKVDLFRCAAAQNGLKQFPGTSTVRPNLPQQMASDWVEVTLDLQNVHQTGYQAYFSQAGHLIVDIKPPFASASVAGKRIAIDPGHGGVDSGAVGPTRYREKDVNLAISQILKRELVAAGAEAVLTRETDKAVGPGSPAGAELEARVAKSKGADPDLFISVHNNAVGSGSAATAYGTETYYWTPMSQLLAAKIQQELVAALGTRDRFVGWQRFYVLRETDCPRVLVECAFISHPEEEVKLKDAGFQARAARGILAGIQSYLAAAVQPPTVSPAVPGLDLLSSSLLGPEG